MLAEYVRYDGVGLADLVARGKTSPQELLDAAIAEVERPRGAGGKASWSVAQTRRS